MKSIERIKSAKRAAAPLVAVNTSDPAASVAAIVAGVNGNGLRAVWDVVRGFRPANEESRELLASAIGNEDYAGNPIDAVLAVEKFPERSITFIKMADRYLGKDGSEAFIQAVWNSRDSLKVNGSMIILLGTQFAIPPELVNDIVLVDEQLPDDDALEGVITAMSKDAEAAFGPSAKYDGEDVSRAVNAIRGLSAFGAEQAVAMSFSRQGADMDSLWEFKRRQIEQTPGLSICRSGMRFADLGGLDRIKSYASAILGGKRAPNAVVFLDEIEKAMAGSAGDTSGTSQDQLGTILSHMQDTGAVGMIFVGPPGAAKSAVAKAIGNEGGIPTVSFDLGASKGSLVGQSESRIRQALKVINAVSSGRALWIATSNNISSLPPELRRRFKRGTFFFDLPGEDEREKIWEIYCEKYGIDNVQENRPVDAGWTGADIEQCVDIAWDLGLSLREAAENVVPVSRSAPDVIERLRREADGRYLSASHPGTYSMPGSRFNEKKIDKKFSDAT